MSGQLGAADDEEVPLEITDYGCDNTFEEAVHGVEIYLLELFQHEPRLRALLHDATAMSSSRSDSNDDDDESQASSRGGSSSSNDDDRTRNSNSDSAAHVKEVHSDVSPSIATQYNVQPLVLGRLFQLRRESTTLGALRPRCVQLMSNSELEVPLDAFSVEVHLCDLEHPVSLFFCLPFFLLIRSVNVHATYKPSESLYYLSILATAVGNVFNGRPFTLDLSDLYETFAVMSNSPIGEWMQQDDVGALSPPWLSSPFTLPPHCVPCMVPIGDQYEQSYRGVAPPSTSSGLTLLPRHLRQSEAHVLLASLFAQPSFGIHFRSTAPASATAQRSLSSLVDLFQLQLGPQSLLQTSVFDGICVSVRKAYSLDVPFLFREPLTHSYSSTPKSATMSGSRSNDDDDTRSSERLDEPKTWNQIVERENELLQALCGDHTYRVGTDVAPVTRVEFVFDWPQLRDTAVFSWQDDNHPDPFRLTMNKVNKAPWTQCVLTARAGVRSEQRLPHVVQAVLQPFVQRAMHHLACVSRGEIDAYASLRDEARGSTTTSPSASVSARLKHYHSVVAEGNSGAAHRRNGAVDDDDDDAAELTTLVESLMNDPVAPCVRVMHDSLIAHLSEDGKASGANDPRCSYPPDSLLARLAYVSAALELSPQATCALWRRCIAALRRRIEEQGSSGVRNALAILGLPQRDSNNNNSSSTAVVDLTQSLFIQKCQLLAYSLELMSHSEPTANATRHSTDGWDIDTNINNSNTADDDNKTVVSSPPLPPISTNITVDDAGKESALQLITNGEPLRIPPTIPTPPCTTDMLQQRAFELNALGTGRSAQITRSWLQSDGLYNDMCLFLYVNEAHKGRTVRFPDFVHWHSPRDFVMPATAVRSSAQEAVVLEDNAYLSARMQITEEMTGQTNIWWYLWQRAVPCSYEQIIANAFRPHEQATLLLRWLEREVNDQLILGEVVHASLVNALHRPLAHRLVVDAGDMDSSGAAIPALRARLRDETAAIARLLLTASASVNATQATNAAPALPVDVEALQTIYDEVMAIVARINTALCAAITLEKMFGRYSPANKSRHGRMAAQLMRALSSPMQNEANTTCVTLKSAEVSLQSWLTLFVRRFEKESERRPGLVMARLTCMAERPLHTAACMQQLTILHDNDTMCFAITLSHEVQ